VFACGKQSVAYECADLASCLQSILADIEEWMTENANTDDGDVLQARHVALLL
jgi:hypothetical protein